MMQMIYDKSDKGRQEIFTRKYALAPKLRALLVLIDGKHSGQALVQKFSFLGLSEQVIVELLDQGFIQGMVPAAIGPHAAPEQRQDLAVANGELAEPAMEQGAESEPNIAPGILEPGETQFRALYHFYTHTVKGVLGLRGFVLQLKVERCGSIDDFRALRAPYLQAVLKAQGEEMVRSLGGRLDQLLNLAQTPSNTVPM